MSRREQIRLSDEEVAAFLDEQRTIVLCSNGSRGHPHPAPMWFVVDDGGAILMTTYAKSVKVGHIEADPRVSLLVESGEAYHELKGVVLYGEAAIEDDTDVVAAALGRVSQRYTDGRADPQELAEVLRPQAEKRVRLRVSPQRVVSWDHAKLGGVY